MLMTSMYYLWTIGESKMLMQIIWRTILKSRHAKLHNYVIWLGNIHLVRMEIALISSKSICGTTSKLFTMDVCSRHKSMLSCIWARQQRINIFTVWTQSLRCYWYNYNVLMKTVIVVTVLPCMRNVGLINIVIYVGFMKSIMKRRKTKIQCKRCYRIFLSQTSFEKDKTKTKGKPVCEYVLFVFSVL